MKNKRRIHRKGNRDNLLGLRQIVPVNQGPRGVLGLPGIIFGE